MNMSVPVYVLKDSFNGNTKYNRTVQKLCESGQAKYVKFDDSLN